MINEDIQRIKLKIQKEGVITKGPISIHEIKNLKIIIILFYRKN
ncbi:hypothetical protein SAMN02745136_03905 [Anaerocolumna jejuensis DSM 15929]|uniref:Uncharacterized protein n=1 Tax=Anaerocolumna jejuensis DSM 15929 TaxID=1121322 RepID=A0A1M6XB98_9FIRM|nr:hypothetical protein SAMN02745136_03905 [Anaerocolumna jejuensis DSM 15929]